MDRDDGLSPLICPLCVIQGRGTHPRIGGQRVKCKACNRFSQAVSRAILKVISEQLPETFRKARLIAEAQTYPRYLEEYLDLDTLGPRQVFADIAEATAPARPNGGGGYQ